MGVQPLLLVIFGILLVFSIYYVRRRPFIEWNL